MGHFSVEIYAPPGSDLSGNQHSHVLQFTERVVMHKGRLAPEGSTATAYAWLVWIDGEDGTQLRWIEPCRKRLERPEDYQ